MARCIVRHEYCPLQVMSKEDTRQKSWRHWTSYGIHGEWQQSEKANSSSEQTSMQPGQQSLVPVGQGLAALPRKLVDRVRANEYIDFLELPPAKGKTRTASQMMDGQILLVQAADLNQSRKIIPDLDTWLQCYALYVAILAPDQPRRIPELMAYQTIISKASQRYKWPSWVVYDQSFRQEMAGAAGQPWSRVDPSIYALCFTGQAVSGENWCSNCQSLLEVCRKFNRFAGDCKFGKDCKFRHACSSCGEPHPVSCCKTNEAGVHRRDSGN